MIRTPYNKFLIIFVLLVSISCGSQNFSKLSKKVSTRQEDKTGTSKGYTFHQIRKKLFREKESGLLKKDFDTLYLLETFSIESGTYYGKIWSKNDSMSYSYATGKFNFINQNRFTLYTCYLVTKWDTLSIRYEEKKYSDMIPNYTIYASMIIKKNNSFEIKTLMFKEFFKVDRDRLN